MRSSRFSAAITVGLMIPLLSAANSAFGQDVALPENSAAWLNSGPITARMLKGKAAVLYYFEES